MPEQHAVLWGIKLIEWLTLIALFVGPVLGVWLAEHLSKHKTKNERKHWLFRALLSNRSVAIALARVEAINLIPYEFRGVTTIINAWRTYVNSTNVTPANDEEHRRFTRTMNDNYDSLLFAIANHLKIGIEQRDILQGSYQPGGLSNLMSLEFEWRAALAKLGNGEVTITTKSLEGAQ